MPETQHRMQWHNRAWIAGALLLASLSGGCSSGGGFGASAPATEASHGFSGSSSLTDFFSGASARAPQTVTNGQPDAICPRVEVRQGASTLTVGANGDKSAMSLRYQGTFVREGRECTVVDGNMVMKVGVEGRVIVGPAGGPGQVEVPLRIAVVQETPGGTRPIVTKYIPLAVTIGPNDGNVPFIHIEEGLSFPLPTAVSLLDSYIVYVGFDPLSAEVQNKQNQKPKPKPRRRPMPAASTN